MGARKLQVKFSGDELILVLVSLVRSINPVMLEKTPDGFAVDFEVLEQQRGFSPAEILLRKVRAALEGSEPPAGSTLELSAEECRDLARVVEQLESSQPWPADALEMSRRLRARLLAAP